MGIPSGKSFDARPGDGPDRGTGRTQTPQHGAGGKGVAAGLILALLAAFAASAEPLRVATWHVELARRGPGLLLRDILKGEDPGIAAVVETIAQVAPDVLLLTGVDWDYGQRTLDALAGRLRDAGQDYPYRFTRRPNSGLTTGLDLDGDGRTGGPGDAQGYGRYPGYGGMALLSRVRIDRAAATDFSAMLWRDLPDALLPEKNGMPFPSERALQQQRLSSVGHWIVPLVLGPDRRIDLLAFSAGTPVFDGPEDRNGRRNHDEIVFWRKYLDGALPWPAPQAPVVVLGNANLDPSDGDGLRGAILSLLSDPRLQDPRPASRGGIAASAQQGGVNAAQRGDPALDTADWSDEDGPGNLRISYVLPDASLNVLGSGVFWPTPDEAAFTLITAEGAPRHRLVWVDIDVPEQAIAPE